MSALSGEDLHAVESHLQCAMAWAFPADVKHVGLAVSGGGDSMAMLDLYRRYAPDKKVLISVVTVDHGLRPEAAGEARLVADYCARHGISHHIAHWDGTQAKGNLMAAAREARYRLITQWARAQDIPCVALAHTADDQAETVLMAMARGSGVDGLAAMTTHSQKHGITFIRPLLKVARADLRRYLTAHGLTWAEDPSNDNPAFERVRMRRALPVLDDLGLTVDALGQVAHAAQMAASLVAQKTAEDARRVVRFDRSDLLIETRPRPPIHPETERRIMLAALAYIGKSVKQPRTHQLARMDHGLAINGIHVLAGCVITKEDTGLRITREVGAIDQIGRPNEMWDNRWTLLSDQAGEVRALGEAGLAQCPDWRSQGLPRRSLLAHPGLWRGQELIAAPTVGMAQGTCAELTLGADHFFSTALSH